MRNRRSHEREAAWLVAGLLVTVGAGAGAGSTLGAGQRQATTAQGVHPVLTIRSPRSGDTVTPPWPVHYTIAGLNVGPNHPVRIRLALAGPYNRTMQLTAKRLSGVVNVPDDRFLSGRRDVVFTLLRSDGSVYTNSRASYTVTNLTIAGNR